MRREVMSYKLWVMSLITFLTYNLSLITNNYCFAQDSDKLVTLSKQIIEAKANEDLYNPFEELKELYFSRPAIKSEGGIPPEAGKDNKYTEFVEFLKSLGQKKKTLEPFTNYYIALTRYHQLRYLEEKQNWDEYFSLGNSYRDEITQGAKNAVDSTTSKDALHIYSRLILWQFHRDQQDAFHEQALSDLMNSILEYAKDAKDSKPLRTVADRLLAYGEKGKSKELYKIYVDKMLASSITDEQLSSTAMGFYKEGNLELSGILYDAYIEKITKSHPLEKLIPILIDIAKTFAYKDKVQNDMFYAEKIFQKIEELGGKKSFDEELMYLRAFNLEKAKVYAKAKDIYIDLVDLNPQGAHADEADYKVGIIYVYVLRDVKIGRGYFEKLAQKETLKPQVISSLYQLGLLNQWQDELTKSKEYYNELLEKAKDGFLETVTLAKARIKEINEAKPLEYNLKTFLDVSLKEENANIDMAKSNLDASVYRPKKDEEVTITSVGYMPESGCMQVELQYLWSGDIGKTKVPTEQLPLLPVFSTAYADSGTKVINLLIVSPTGVIDRNIDMVDVY